MLRRGLLIAAGVVLVTMGLGGTASAVPLSCFKSATTVAQGGTLTVSGTADTAGEFLRAVMDRATTPVQVGTGNADASGAAPFNYSFTVTIPATTSANVTHTLEVTDAGGGGAVNCGDILVTEAAAPTPTPTPTPTPEPTEDQAQLQETLDELRDAIEALDAPAAVPAQQQQQQQQIIPVGTFVHGPSLPKTGVEVLDIGGAGLALLLIGGSLMQLGRRRGRARVLPPLDDLPPLDVTAVPPEVWAPGSPHPSEFVGVTEADVVLVGHGERALRDDDLLTPSF